MMNRYSLAQKISLYIGVSVFLLFILLPFFEMFMTSLRPMHDIYSAPYKFWSDEMSFDAYFQIWKTVPMLPRYILNSLFIALCVTLLALALIIPSAYAYARIDFYAKKASIAMLLGINMFSGAVLLIPLFKVMRSVGLLNTYGAMIVPGTAFLIPTGIWLLKTYLEKIPKELEEAAYMDGANRWYTMRKVILPLAKPGLIVVSVTLFISAYAQQFLFAITFNRVSEYMPLPAGLFEFMGHETVNWNQMMAASIIGVLPVLALFLVMQRHLVAGMMAGSVKA